MNNISGGEALKPMRLKVCFYYPAQIVRNLGLEISKINFKACKEYKIGHLNLNITLWNVRVLRKRHNDKTLVNSNADNQDNQLMKTAIKVIGCIPPYWKSLLNETLYGTSFCRNLTQLQTEFKCMELIKNGKMPLNNDDSS